jgi:hypothetical protein
LPPSPAENPENPFVTEVELNTVIDEFNNRFEVLATEINGIKDILLKLQSYTMDVNKLLLNDRIQILSGLDNNDNDKDAIFEISNPILDNISKSGIDLVKKDVESADGSSEIVFSTDI